MRRVVVVGVAGSGKTTVAAVIANRLGVAHVELDGVFHQRNYSRVRDVVWGRADTVVVLDLPRWRAMSQLLARTLRRVARREELWNGNREEWRNLVRIEPEQNILLWSWVNHAKNRVRYRAASADARWAHLTFLRVRSRREITALLGKLPAPR